MQTIMFLMQAIIIIFLLFKKKVKSRRLLESRSSLSSSCSFNIKIFDVFLSFRGADTRKSFISFLYKDLVAKEIRTFKDDKELKTGRQISPELIQAIKGSRIAIVVVSATYTASFWCLEELVKILKLEKQRLLTVVPIFYEVDPCHVRRQIGEVEKHFKKHEKRQSIETVKSWRDALTYLADLSGECSKDWEDYSKLVDKITEDISKMLSAETPSNGKNLIGIDKHMNELYPRLDLNSNQDLQVIGISGTGSMGRSALARHAYEKISHNFEAHCFIEDVRRVSLQCRKSYLQEKILSKMQGQGLSTKMCPNAIKARVRNKKVLLVANDVDNFEQLDAIANEASWFGPGSIIIINTPNKQLLSSLAVNSVYEVGLLRCCDVRYLVRSEAITQRENQFDEVELFRCYDGRRELLRSEAITQRENQFDEVEFFRCYDGRELLRSEAITQRENQFGFKRSTYLYMSLSGTNHFSTLKHLARATYYWNQKSREAQMLVPPTKTTTRQQLCAKVKTYFQQKAKAKARQCSSQTVKMLSYR